MKTEEKSGHSKSSKGSDKKKPATKKVTAEVPAVRPAEQPSGSRRLPQEVVYLWLSAKLKREKNPLCGQVNVPREDDKGDLWFLKADADGIEVTVKRNYRHANSNRAQAVHLRNDVAGDYQKLKSVQGQLVRLDAEFYNTPEQRENIQRNIDALKLQKAQLEEKIEAQEAKVTEIEASAEVKIESWHFDYDEHMIEVSK